MELLLELSLPQADRDPATLDVRLETDTSDTIAQITSALLEHAEARGYGPFDPSRVHLRVEPGREVLDPAAKVGDTDLVSGQTLVVDEDPGPVAGQDPGPRGVVSLDVAAGPEAGRFIELPPGIYRIGRSGSCDVVIDDPTMSKHHLTVEVTTDLKARVTPAPDTSNGTFTAGTEITGTRELGPEELVQAGATALSFRPLGDDHSLRRDLLGQIPFNRVPHHRVVVRERVFDPLVRPPDEPRGHSFPILAALLPLVAGVAMAVLFERPQFLLFAALSPIMLVGRYISDRRSGRLSYAKAKADFLARVESRAAEIAEALEQENSERFRAAPDVAELSRHAQFHHGGLWQRQRQDPDFLSLRLGLGDLESRVNATVERGGDPILRAHADEAFSHRSIIHTVPVTVELNELHVLGLFGDDDAVTGLGTSLVIQTACLHSPEDLVIAAAVPEENAGRYAWLKWLPHTRSATSPLEGEHLAKGSDQTNRLLLNLLTVADERLGRRPDSDHGHWPRVLVVLHEGAQPDRAIMSQLLDVADRCGIAVVWLGHGQLQLPRQCRATVTVADPLLGNRSRLRFTDPDKMDRDFEMEGVTAQLALTIARSLAPIRDASAATVTTAIPRTVPLLDLLSLPQPSPENVVKRWRIERPYGISAPLGMAADGPFYVDLVSDGPHALIAGTSGAGKSELLQSLVASLATTYSPERLNFLFIDYKGGASSAEFRRLPHTVGYVTNLDGRLSVRALTSLRAELDRRMAVMDGRAKDLAEMLVVAPEEAPPSLVIVVDEFATLVKEIPDFVAGIVDIAQRGRSLGIHLVLATQRPAGAVNDNILANTNLRIALRVVDPVDSTSVIGSKEAADIPVPLRGRAYARLGPRRLVGFQCAWSGARYERDHAVRRVSVTSFAFGGADSNFGTSTTPATVPGAAPTHLEVLVDAVASAAGSLDLPPPQRPWLEPLGDVVFLEDVLAQAGPVEDPARRIPLGMIDNPENQAQHPAIIDLELGGGLLLFGTGGAGKTTTLRSVAAAAALQGSADAVQIYGLDFASRSLSQLVALPQCSAVATGDDPEKVTRIITVLENELARRRIVLGDRHAETLSALRSASGTLAMARIIVLVDGYGGFQAAFDKPDTYEWVTRFQRLVSDGRQVGIHGVIASDRRAGVPSALFSAISTRVVLRMSDPEEMGLLGIPAKMAKEAELGPGRGFLGSAEIQIACVSADHSGAAQAAKLSELSRRIPPPRAPALPELPDLITVDELGDPPGRLRIPIGVADLSLETRSVDLERGHLVVAGPPGSGRTNALALVATSLQQAKGDIRLAALGAMASPLADRPLWDMAAFERKKQGPLLEEIASFVATNDSGDVQIVVFVDEASDIDDQAARALEGLISLDAVRFVVALDAAVLARGFSGWIGALRRNRSLLILQPESRSEVEQLANVKVRFRPAQEFPPGRGVLIGGRTWDLVHLARA